MKYDIYSSYTTKINDTEEKTLRTRLVGIEQASIKEKIIDIVDGMPEDATEFYMNIEKNWDSQMDVLDI